MNLLVSVLLLTAFIVFVELLFGETDGFVARLGRIVAHAELVWPSGVQEEDRAPASLPEAWPGRFAGGADRGIEEAAASISLVIEDGVAPIDVARVTGGRIHRAESVRA